MSDIILGVIGIFLYLGVTFICILISGWCYRKIFDAIISFIHEITNKRDL